MDLHRGKDMDRLLQLLERGLLKRIGRRRPDERAQVVVNCAEDVFTKTQRDVLPCRKLYFSITSLLHRSEDIFVTKKATQQILADIY